MYFDTPCFFVYALFHHHLTTQKNEAMACPAFQISTICGCSWILGKYGVKFHIRYV